LRSALASGHSTIILQSGCRFQSARAETFVAGVDDPGHIAAASMHLVRSQPRQALPRHARYPLGFIRAWATETAKRRPPEEPLLQGMRTYRLSPSSFVRLPS